MKHHKNKEEVKVRMDTEDGQKIVFITYQGLYQFKVMPFGLCNMPAVYKSLTEQDLPWALMGDLPHLP